jgi:hypothetical protein
VDDNHVDDSGDSAGNSYDAKGGIVAAALVVISVVLFGALAMAALVGAIVR